MFCLILCAASQAQKPVNHSAPGMTLETLGCLALLSLFFFSVAGFSCQELLCIFVHEIFSFHNSLVYGINYPQRPGQRHLSVLFSWVLFICFTLRQENMNSVVKNQNCLESWNFEPYVKLKCSSVSWPWSHTKARQCGWFGDVWTGVGFNWIVIACNAYINRFALTKVRADYS